MEGFGWILSIILGAIAGWIAEKIMKSDHGLLMNRYPAVQYHLTVSGSSGRAVR